MEEELALLDENGVPKYKGKKRGRKPKKQKRIRDPNAPKRKHAAYTLVSTSIRILSSFLLYINYNTHCFPPSSS